MKSKNPQELKQVVLEAPDFEVLGTLDHIVLQGGYNNDDGFYYSRRVF
jgi:hypothetical protein